MNQGLDQGPASRRGGTDWRRGHLMVLLVMAVAFTIRLGYLAQIDRSPSFNVALLKGQTDSYVYWMWARELAGGDWTFQGANTQSPLYPYFLAVIFRLLGPDNLLLPRLIQVLLGTLTVGLCAWLARRLAGGLAGPCAGLILACYGPGIFFDAAILRDGMLSLLNLALVAAMVTARDRPGPARGALVGALLGLAVIGKPNIAVMLPLFPVWIYEMSAARRARAPELRRLLAGVVIGLALALAPLVARNLAAGLPPLMISPQGALEFITGNHPDAPTNGWQPTPEIVAMNQQCHNRLGCGVVAVLKLYRGHPGGLILRQLAKTWDLLYAYEAPSALSFYVEKRYVPFFRLPWLNWAVLLGLGAIGASALWKQRRAALPLYAYLVLYSLGTIAFYVVDRFRIPLAPALAVCAGCGAAAIITELRRRGWVRAGAMIAIALAIMAIVWPREIDDLQPTDYHNLVRYHLIRQEPQAARDLIDEGKAKAVQALVRRDDAFDRYRLARLRFTAGDPLPAVAAELEHAARLNPAPWLASLIAIVEQDCQGRARDGDPTRFGFRL
jgi:4-amino-4-deoxy-L-arabinose transferase-like glycosyltransferase